MSNFKTGDVVNLKSSPDMPMTVCEAGRSTIHTMWFDGSDLRREVFPPEVLRLHGKKTETKPAEVKKPRKKRAWAKCSVEGCDANVYMPSGAKKMCYKHHLEAGGKPTPLAKVNKKSKKAKKTK